MEFEREIPMSIEAFHRMPWRLGWKHEYFEDRAYLSPSYVSMEVYLPAPSWPPEISGLPGEGSAQIRAVDAADAPELERLFFDAFRPSVEFIGYGDGDVRARAREALRAYFEGGPHPQASRVVVEEHGIVGAMIVIETDGNPFTHLLMIHSARQRIGLGRALLSNVTAALRKRGCDVLRSRFFVANEPSCRWHGKVGFIEDPDFAATSHYRSFYRHELLRLQEDPNVDSGEFERVRHEFERWDRLAEMKGVLRWGAADVTDRRRQADRK